MGLGKKTIDDQNYCGKKVLVRCDFNVPMKDGVITNENRINAALPTIQKLVNDGAKVILCSHLGKPKNGPEAKFSLAPVAVALSAKLGKTVVFADDDNVVGENAKAAVAAMNNGDVVLLQNTRFRKEETKNMPEFSEELASLADAYVDDAFGSCHRAHCSTAGVTDYIKDTAVGYLMEKEIKYLGNAVNDPVRPFTAILGGASAFVESTLAQIYKRKNKDGSSYGGPSYYMETALRQRWLGVVFAIIIILTYAVGYNMLASYNLQSAFAGFSFYGDHSPFLIGLILAVLFAACVLGGAHRLTKVTGTLVPIMGVLYVVIALVVVLMHLNLVPTVFQNIFASAFDFPAIFGGFAGSCMMEGIKRGLYSNEAGMGSAPNAAATADVSHPVKQGLVQMLSVFIDTLLVCTATASPPTPASR